MNQQQAADLAREAAATFRTTALVQGTATKPPLTENGAWGIEIIPWPRSTPEQINDAKDIVSRIATRKGLSVAADEVSARPNKAYLDEMDQRRREQGRSFRG